MKILISTPSYGKQVNAEMVQSLLRSTERLKQMDKTGQGISFNWHSSSSSMLAFNRNIAADIAVKEHYDFLLFWDADISVDEPDFILGMVETAHKTTADIVGLPIVLKGEPKTYNYAFQLDDGRYENAKDIVPFIRPFDVDVVGTGMMLIWVNLLKKMEKPWFTFTDTYGEQPGCFPEDWNFCEKAKPFTKIVVDPRFTPRHWGLKDYV